MKTILIIDDDPDVRDVLRIALTTERPYRVVEAQDGEDGLEKMRRERPDVVLCDIRMPRLNGYQFVVRTAQDPALSRVPVIIMTSLTSDGERTDEQWRQSMGVADFISKPFHPTDIVQRVDRLVANGTR